ncbi:hypothetical protein MTR_7g007270 [Medicago truncatula]|uniref:Uncharacterized protein n=1 Tax=Medicago truncatula TaxID=3880 RepID=A0A072TVK9_MEDTR|nr:hypothetical protein MTR_7g007270 [Medicago truncatula]
MTRCSLEVVPVTHNVLFKAFLEYMRSKRFKPDKDSFVGLVTLLCAKGRIDEAVSAYHDVVMKYPYSDFQVGELKWSGFPRLLKLGDPTKGYTDAKMSHRNRDIELLEFSLTSLHLWKLRAYCSLVNGGAVLYGYTENTAQNRFNQHILNDAVYHKLREEPVEQ